MFVLPELTFAPDSLEPHIDALTMQIHHDKHHATYVKNLNDVLTGTELENKTIEEIISNLDQVPETIRTKVRNNGGGHLNHSMFWLSLSASGGQPEGALSKSLTKTFGSLEEFKSKFKEAALARFGSGWTWLVSKDGQLSIESTANQDNPMMEGKTPLLGLDVWEHAYYLKYQNRRADYVDAWWNVVNWEYVASRIV